MKATTETDAVRSAAAKVKRKRHKWSEASRTEYLTVRLCGVCGLCKITDHNPTGFPEITYRYAPLETKTTEVFIIMPECEIVE